MFQTGFNLLRESFHRVCCLDLRLIIQLACSYEFGGLNDGRLLERCADSASYEIPCLVFRGTTKGTHSKITHLHRRFLLQRRHRLNFCRLLTVLTLPHAVLDHNRAFVVITIYH